MNEWISWLAIFTVIIFVFGSAAYASFRAAPWLPLRNKDHARVLKFLKGRQGTFLELGAGDARLLVDVARSTSLRGVGYEVSVIPYCAGFMRLAFLGLLGKTQLKFRDFFFEDFSQADSIFCFLTPPAMKRLKPKFEQEARPGSRIVSYSFAVPGWKPTRIDREGGGIPVFVYDR